MILRIRKSSNSAVGFLAVAALFQIVDGLQVAASAALRGIKDTKAAMVLSLVSYWGIGLTAGWIFCFQLGWNGVGLWLGMTMGWPRQLFY